MLGSGIIFSVFKGEGAPETDKILDFCRSAVGCVSDNACLSERDTTAQRWHLSGL
jgi:hypothetical protein